MRATLAFLVALSLVAGFTSLPTQSAHSATAGDWRQFRGPAGLGVSADHGVPLDQVKRQILCFNRADGKLLWSADVPSKLPEGRISRGDHGCASSTPVTDGERLYAFFGKSGVLAFDLNGRQLWQADVGEQLHEWGSAASPVLFKNLVIINASTESGSLVALDRPRRRRPPRPARCRRCRNGQAT